VCSGGFEYEPIEPPVTEKRAVMKDLKIIVEQHPDGYVVHPLGLKGIVVGEGDT
jgi:hypothetical protein